MNNPDDEPKTPPVAYVGQPDLAAFIKRLVVRLRAEKRSAIILVDPSNNVIRVFDARPAGRMPLD